jgi:hypothetical protein
MADCAGRQRVAQNLQDRSVADAAVTVKQILVECSDDEPPADIFYDHPIFTNSQQNRICPFSHADGCIRGRSVTDFR